MKKKNKMKNGFFNLWKNFLGFFSFFSAERGFNMFSAIVALLLILIGVVLTSTLITTEEKTNRQIYGMLNNYQLADAANLARADALQSFNYNFRERLEDYLTFNSSELTDSPGFTLFRIGQTSTNFENWSDVVSAFEKAILLLDSNEGRNFARAVRYVADHTIADFDQGTYGKFNVTLSDNGINAQDALHKALMKAISTDPEHFLEVVDCDGETSCKTGTFYFKVNLGNLDNATYEALPRIIVKDQTTQEEIKMAILPKTNLRIYIPLRFFKALFIAKKLAESTVNMHRELDGYQLGFCSDCVPNTDPGNPDGSPAPWAKECPTVSVGSETPLAEVDGAAPAGVTEYFSGGGTAGMRGLQATAAKKICKAAFTTANNALAYNASDTTFSVKDTRLEPDQEQRITAIDGCGFYSMTVATGAEPKFQASGINAASGAFLRCGRINAVYSDIVFKEDNKQYIVKGTYDGGRSDLYKIRIEATGFEDIVPDEDTPGGLSNLPVCYSTRTSCSATR
jgi:hypothetical protein